MVPMKICNLIGKLTVKIRFLHNSTKCQICGILLSRILHCSHFFIRFWFYHSCLAKSTIIVPFFYTSITDTKNWAHEFGYAYFSYLFMCKIGIHKSKFPLSYWSMSVISEILLVINFCTEKNYGFPILVVFLWCNNFFFLWKMCHNYHINFSQFGKRELEQYLHFTFWGYN